jgi:hypothetical protein
MWDSRDDVILTEAERKALAELEAAATRHPLREVWGRLRAHPHSLLVTSAVMATLSLCFTTAVFATSLVAGVFGALLLLASLAALFDSVAAVAADRPRRRGRRAEGLRRPGPGPAGGT